MTGNASRSAWESAVSPRDAIDHLLPARCSAMSRSSIHLALSLLAISHLALAQEEAPLPPALERVRADLADWREGHGDPWLLVDSIAGLAGESDPRLADLLADVVDSPVAYWGYHADRSSHEVALGLAARHPEMVGRFLERTGKGQERVDRLGLELVDRWRAPEGTALARAHLANSTGEIPFAAARILARIGGLEARRALFGS